MKMLKIIVSLGGSVLLAANAIAAGVDCQTALYHQGVTWEGVGHSDGQIIKPMTIAFNASVTQMTVADPNDKTPLTVPVTVSCQGATQFQLTTGGLSQAGDYMVFQTGAIVQNGEGFNFSGFKIMNGQRYNISGAFQARLQ